MNRKLDYLHRLALFAVITNASYVAWLFFNVDGALGYTFWTFEFLIAFVTFIFAFNHWKRHYTFLGGQYSLRSSVDIFIPTVNEPIEMLSNTIEAAKQVSHPRTTVHVLDDGRRSPVKHLAKKLGVNYIARPDYKQKSYKAANLNYALRHTRGDFILTIDADNIVYPEILDDLLGHFRKPEVGIVASRQSFSVEKHDFNHDHLFYNYMQSGKNADGAAISCGSGVIYRRSALDKIGGFSEWNLVEDLFTTYVANTHGIRSVYVTQPYVQGLAPKDLSSIYKQRGTWAIDTLRMFFWKQPLFNRKLTFRQRVHYFEIGYCYLVSAFFLTGVYLVNYFSLIGNTPIVTEPYMYVALRTPALIASVLLFGRLSQGNLTSQIWAGLFPVYQRAAAVALFSPTRKPRYKVTKKYDHGKPEPGLVVPQITFLLIGYCLLAYNLVTFGVQLLVVTNAFWIGVMTYWLLPIILKAFKVGKYS